MPQPRHLHCPVCEKELHIPASWTADYAMTWFYVEHVRDHAAEMIVELTHILMAASLCAGCRAEERVQHRPCFAPDCQCICSRTTTTTTSEETARADG